MCCKTDICLHIISNAKHLPMFLENNCLIQFDFTDFLTQINPFTTKPGCFQLCFELNANQTCLATLSWLGKMDLMLADMKNSILTLKSTIILLKMLTPCYPIHIETLAVIYWNPCVALKCRREKSVDVSQLYKNHGCDDVNKHSQHSYFIVKVCKLNRLHNIIPATQKHTIPQTKFSSPVASCVWWGLLHNQYWQQRRVTSRWHELIRVFDFISLYTKVLNVLSE